MTIAQKVDDLEFIFQNLRIEHEFMTNAHRRFDMLRHTRRKILNGSTLRSESRCATLFADTQSGKTTTVKTYMERQVVDYCYETGLFSRDIPRSVVSQLQRIVVHISVSGTSTLMSLIEDILRAYGDPCPEKGNMSSKKHRLLTYVNEFRTELLIFDEMNHLRIGAASVSARFEATRVHNTLKDFLLGGCPVVFVGTMEAKDKVLSDSQIRARCAEQLFIGPLSYRNARHRTVYKEFCGLLGLNLQRSGLFPDRSNFIDEKTLVRLFVASGGYLGHTANLIERAALYAIEDGAPKVNVGHLAAASDDYTIFNKLATYNPFRKKDAAERKSTTAEAVHA